MTKAAGFALGFAMVAAGLLALGCSSGGGTDHSTELAALSTQLDELEKDLAAERKEEAEAKEEPETPASQSTLAAAAAAADSPAADDGDDEKEIPVLTPGNQAVSGDTGSPGTGQQTPTTSGTSAQIEATLRGEGVHKALPDAGYGTSGRIPAADFYGTTTKTFRMQAPPLTGSTSARAADGTRNATLTQTLGGEKETIVAYTDREETRTFENQFGEHIKDRQAAKLQFVPPTTAWPLTNVLSTQKGVVSMTASQLPTLDALLAYDENNLNTMRDGTAKTVQASVLGVPGVFGCTTSGNTACDVEVTATYERTATTSKLTGIQLAAATGDIYFQPTNSKTTIKLDGSVTYDGKALKDQEHGVWGWWQRAPASADGAYMIAVFAKAYAAEDTTRFSGATGSATYQGPAAGIYAEQQHGTEIDFGGVKKTVTESGKFTATAVLEATFGDNAAVTGSITGFKTDHGSKSWRIELNASEARFDLPAGTNLGTTHTGSWTHTFLKRHTDSLASNTAADSQPIAAVGTFNVSIENVRHVLGAFGVRRTTPAVGQ